MFAHVWKLKVAALLAVFCLAGMGCREKNEKVSLNPDGSGKSEFKLVAGPQPQMTVSGGSKKAPEQTPEEKLKTAVEGLVNGSPGVDAWENLAFEITKDGRYQISGTAYFKDFSQYQLSLGGMKSKSNIQWAKDGTDGMKLSFLSPNPAATAKPAEPLTDAQIDEQVAKAKAEWQQFKPMAAGILSTLKDETTYLLPGTVKDPGAFEPVPGGVKSVISGKKVMESMDKVMSDDAKLREAIKAGRNTVKDGPSDEEAGAMLLGRPGKLSVTVGGDIKPLFDYAAQSKAAKDQMPDMMKKLGLKYVPASSMPAMPAKPAHP